MIKKLAVLASLAATPAMGDISAVGCYDGECQPLDFKEFWLESARKKETKLAKTIATSTGLVIDAVDSAIGAMSNAAQAAGFDSFKGTFEGPRGKAEFDYNFRTGVIGFVFIPSSHADNPMGKAIK